LAVDKLNPSHSSELETELTDQQNQQSSLTELTADIASAYVGNNSLPAADLAGLISGIFSALSGTLQEAAPHAGEKLSPAVSIKKSVSDEFLICLEDGRKFKSLKRHLRTKYALSPDEYRAKWGLPESYPMVAPAYAAARSALAKQSGLGQGGRKVKGAARVKPAVRSTRLTKRD
jgi:predicted transcriptional regulator